MCVVVGTDGDHDGFDHYHPHNYDGDKKEGKEEEEQEEEEENKKKHEE
jgi:hypothetical protein